MGIRVVYWIDQPDFCSGRGVSAGPRALNSLSMELLFWRRVGAAKLLWFHPTFVTCSLRPGVQHDRVAGAHPLRGSPRSNAFHFGGFCKASAPPPLNRENKMWVTLSPPYFCFSLTSRPDDALGAAVLTTCSMLSDRHWLV